MTRRRLITTTALALAAMVWAGTVAAAYQAIRKFETTPGESAIAPKAWPAKNVIARGANEWSLVMLVHPHCSCSRASVEELQAIVEKSPASVHTYVLVYRPSGVEAGWEKTQVVENASKLRRAKVIMDEDGHMADLFGGFTSGQTFVYDDRGELRFAGGITSLRGHSGINGGREGVIEILRSRTGTGEHPVFGCAITTKKERKSS